MVFRINVSLCMLVKRYLNRSRAPRDFGGAYFHTKRFQWFSQRMQPTPPRITSASQILPAARHQPRFHARNPKSSDTHERKAAATQVSKVNLRLFVHLVRRFGEQSDDVVLEARRVSHEMFKGDGLRIRRRNLKASQVAVHIGVQVQQTLFNQLHDRRPDKHLRVRSYAEQSQVRVDGLAFREICVAISLFEDHLPASNHYHHSPREMLGFLLGLHKTVYESAEFYWIRCGNRSFILGRGRRRSHHEQ